MNAFARELFANEIQFAVRQTELLFRKKQDMWYILNVSCYIFFRIIDKSEMKMAERMGQEGATDL